MHWTVVNCIVYNTNNIFYYADNIVNNIVNNIVGIDIVGCKQYDLQCQQYWLQNIRTNIQNQILSHYLGKNVSRLESIGFKTKSLSKSVQSNELVLQSKISADRLIQQIAEC